jgi:flagellar export protein FliJ
MSLSRLFPLATVLRVRRIQEDAAKAKVAEAQTAVRRAASDFARREALVAGRPTPGSAQSSQWLAATAANLAMAADAFAARRIVMAREDDATDARHDWSKAAMAHEGVERLAEMHAEQVRREQEATAQRAADDRAGADHHLRSQQTRGVDA